MKLEFLALKWGMTEKFREYLLGYECAAYTDNNPLSHLSTGKQWKCRHALSSSGSQDLEVMLLRTPLPKPLGQALQARKTQITQAAVIVLPQHAPADMSDLQQANPVIQEVVTFWKQNQRPIQEEWRLLSQPSQMLL